MAEKPRRGGDLPGHYASNYERELMQRILAEVTEFPLEFRNWMKRFITDTVNESKSEGGSGPGGATGFNPSDWMPGIIIPMGNAAAPLFSLVCDGREVSRATYAALYAAVGDLWGAGDGSATFNLPDLRGRALYGSGGAIPLASTDAYALANRGPSHHHTVSLTSDQKGSHTHTGSTGGGGNHSHGGSVDGGGGHGHSGATDGAGDHQHGANDPGAFATTSGATYVVNSSSGSNRYLITGAPTLTSVNGNHAHNVSLGGGDHSHGLTITGVGDHTHTVSISTDGLHDHLVSGSSSGGPAVDAPAFAVVNYVITTGAIT